MTSDNGAHHVIGQRMTKLALPSGLINPALSCCKPSLMANFAILLTLQLGLSCHSITIDLIPSSNHTVKSLFLVFEKQVFPDRIVT